MKMVTFSTAVFITNQKMLHSLFHQKLTSFDVKPEVLLGGAKLMSQGS